MTNAASEKVVIQDDVPSQMDRELVTAAAVSMNGSTKPAADGMSVLAAVDQAIGAELLDAEQILADELRSENPYVCDILEHSTRFRGKRLRPMLLLLSAKACGGIRQDHKVLSAVVEMIHLATLVHDDVLDDAETRRHVATVNSRWNNETSVLFGDYLFTHSFHLASSLETTYACRRIGRSTNIVCEGELSQIKERGNLDLSEETYFKIIDGKRLSAAITIVTADGSAGERGVIADVLAGAVDEGRIEVIYAAGPRRMLHAVARFCAERRIPSQIAVDAAMACGTGLCFTCVVPIAERDGVGFQHLRACTEGPVFNPARVLWERWLGPEDLAEPSATGEEER